MATQAASVMPMPRPVRACLPSRPNWVGASFFLQPAMAAMLAEGARAVPSEVPQSSGSSQASPKSGTAMGPVYGSALLASAPPAPLLSPLLLSPPPPLLLPLLLPPPPPLPLPSPPGSGRSPVVFAATLDSSCGCDSPGPGSAGAGGADLLRRVSGGFGGTGCPAASAAALALYQSVMAR